MSVHPLASEFRNASSSFLNSSALAAAPHFQPIHSDGFGKAAADHSQEWRDSGVDPGIIALNVETLTDTATQSYSDTLFPIAERLNWNISRFGYKTRSNVRGWWVSGVDPLNNWQRMSWGRFKPDAATPVLDREKGKPAKYLSPSLGSGSSRLVLLDVPPYLWDKVAHRYGISIPDDERCFGFWPWVWKHNLPIILTEGEKKAGCLLTQGYVAIALPGIFNGYRKTSQTLIPELAHFATAQRSVYICFDYETKPKTIRDIHLATTKLGNLLDQAGCTVKVLTLPGPQKGVDDWIVAQGHHSFDALYEAALPLDFWLSTQLWSLTYPAALTLNTPYLGKLPYPRSGLACIKSPKGSGKTTALQELIRDAICSGRKVLVITHRIQLGRAICESIGIDWIEDVKASETRGLLGYGLCIDSLHPTSQARFNPQFWKGAIVILDEVEQVLWHALNSGTCYDHRVKILETLRELVQVVLSSDGLIIAQDADLSDISIDYLQGLLEEPIEPWLVVNQWQPEAGWAVSFYDTKNPAALVSQMEAFIEQGAIFVTLDSQKVSSRWSSKNLETYLHSRHPDKRILRIDSESVADPQHPAYGIVERLNHVLPHYDIVLATPTIGTGVSIDVRGHFKAVFGLFQGVTPDVESRQALARVRDPVPRLVWAARFGPVKVGNGSCSYQDVIHSTTKAVKYTIALLKDVDFDIDSQTDPITLRSWAKMAARVNLSLWSYRNAFRNGLLMEGHQVTIVTNDLLKQQNEALAVQIFQDIKAIQNDSLLKEAQAIATAPTLTPTEYDQLKDQRAKTAADRYAQFKHELQRRYPIPVTPELKLKDDQGWYAQLRLHYYLTHDPAFVRLRDLKEWQSYLDRGDGKVALQDVRLLTTQVETLKALGILNLLNAERQIRASDPDVEQIRQQTVQYSHDIKAVLNLTISEKMTPIEVVQALLGKLGLKLTCIGRDMAPDGRRGGVRVYQYHPPDDRRDTIFAEWQQRDAIGCSTSDWEKISATPASILVGSIDPPPDISVLDQSGCGSKIQKLKQVESVSTSKEILRATSTKPNSTQCAALNSEPQKHAEILVRKFVNQIKENCNRLVMQLEEATAKLKPPYPASELH